MIIVLLVFFMELSKNQLPPKSVQSPIAITNEAATYTVDDSVDIILLASASYFARTCPCGSEAYQKWTGMRRREFRNHGDEFEASRGRFRKG